VRFRFTKQGKVRFTSHRDVARLWERALRRAQLPVASTEGFSPRPKVHFGLALSTGHESLGEYLDVDLREPEALALDVDALPDRLTPLLPIGLDVETAAVVERSGPSLQEAVTCCSWRIEVPGIDAGAARRATAALLAAGSLPVTRERKGKPVMDDIRPAVLELAVAAAPEPVVLEAVLATQPRGVRPAELLDVLSTFVDGAPTAPSAVAPPPGGEGLPTGAPLTEGRVLRTHQWIELDGARREPLPPGATRAVHAQARAS
jgi:radical SAM-linked protein